jgi:predicted transcriptional regulator
MVHMPKTSKKISDVLRAAIISAPVSRYRISKDTGLAASAVSKFVNKKMGLDIRTADILAEYLGLELVKSKRSKGR